MPQKQRAILLKLNEQIKKLNTPPPSTFSPYTGEVQGVYQFPTPPYSQPNPPSSKP